MNKIFIKNIKLDNFKSFEGSVEIGPFHPYLNTVIGPNGSGKSNVFDAISFTFGKRVGDLRSRCLRDLISINNLDYTHFASSSIFLKHEKNLLRNIFRKTMEISVTRKVFKYGKSSFFLNGQKTKIFFLKQFFFFLKFPFERGIFFIKQGEIEKFSTMESSGKLKKQVGNIEYVEEISGSSCYCTFFFKNLKYLCDFDLIKNFSHRYTFQRLKKKDLLLYRKKETLKNLSHSKRILKLFLTRKFFLEILNGQIIKTCKVKRHRFYCRIILLLVKKMKNNILLNFCSTEHFDFFLVNPTKNHTSKNMRYFKHFFISYTIYMSFKKSKKSGNGYFRYNKKIIIKKMKTQFSFFNYFILGMEVVYNLSNRIFNWFFKPKMIFGLIKSLTICDSEQLAQLLIFMNDIVKSGRYKNNDKFQGKLKKIKLDEIKKTIFTINRNFKTIRYYYNSIISVTLNYEKIRLCYSIKKLKEKFDLCDKIKKKIKSIKSMKVNILKKIFLNLQTSVSYLHFSEKAISIAIVKYFSNELDLLVLGHQRFFFSQLIFFRNNLNQRYTLFRNTKHFFSKKLSIIPTKNKDLFRHKKLFFWNNHIKRLTIFLGKPKLIKTNNTINDLKVEKICQYEQRDITRDFVNLSKNNFFNCLDFKNSLLGFFKKLKNNYHWIFKFFNHFIDINSKVLNNRVKKLVKKK